MDSSKSIFEVQVAGIPLKLRSSHNQDVALQLAELVNNKLNQVMSTSPHVSYQSALLLTALNLAEDIYLLKKAVHCELTTLEKRAERILEQVDLVTGT